MRNAAGTPIWYELLSSDADASKTIDEAVIGWTVGPRPEGDMDYRMIDTASGETVGGLMHLSPQMVQGGATPTWLFYIGVEDVDATVSKITQAGGSVHLPAFDMPGVGRMAMVADPQGNPFYVMRGDSDEPSRSWERMGMGKCNWHELSTTDQAAGNGFYAQVFGWSYPDKMEMPGMGDYVFVEAGGETIGATMMQAGSGQPAGWQFYFRASDIEAAAETFRAKGGTVFVGPMEVPGGDRIIFGTDPAGSPVGVVGPGETR